MFALVVFLFAGNPLPALDPRVESVHFLVEGEVSIFNPDGTLKDGSPSHAWSGEIRFHRDGAISMERRSDAQKGVLSKLSVIHGGETHDIQTFQGKLAQMKRAGDIGDFFAEMNLRGLPDTWPTLFAPYNPLFRTIAAVPKRVEQIGGIDHDVMDVPFGRSRMMRYWLTKDAHPNVVRWEEFKVSKPTDPISRCEIRLGRIPLEGGFFTFPVESIRSVFEVMGPDEKKMVQYKIPQQVFATRIIPASMKVNTITDRDSISFAYDNKSQVFDQTKPQPVAKTTAVKDSSAVEPSSPDETSKALLERGRSAGNSWWLLGLASTVVGVISFVLWRRS